MIRYRNGEKRARIAGSPLVDLERGILDSAKSIYPDKWPVALEPTWR